MNILSRLVSQPAAKLCIPIFGSAHQVQLEKFTIAKPGTSQCITQSSDSSSWMKKVVNWVLELLTSKCLRFAISLPCPGDMHTNTNNHIYIPSRLLEFLYIFFFLQCILVMFLLLSTHPRLPPPPPPPQSLSDAGGHSSEYFRNVIALKIKLGWNVLDADESILEKKIKMKI